MTHIISVTPSYPELFEPSSDKTNEMTCAPSKDSDQPGHPPSLIRVFAVRMKKHWVLSYPLSAQQRFWSDWVDSQADLSLRWAQSHFVGFVKSGSFMNSVCRTMSWVCVCTGSGEMSSTKSTTGSSSVSKLIIVKFLIIRTPDKLL